MTFSQLRAYVAVATNGSVRGAADELMVSQPAVSAAVAALQRELGVTLLSRNGRGVQLTAAGRIFAGYARQLLGLVDEATAATTGQEHPERGRVRLAAVTTAGEHVLPRFLASFRERYPEAEVSLEVGNKVRVWDLLEHREVDLAIGGRPPGGRRLASLATRPNVLVLVAAGKGEGRHSRDVSVHELGRQTLLLREAGSGTRSTAEELFDELGLSPRTLTVGSNGAIRESVQVGLGITLISRDAVARELEMGTLEEWRRPTLPRHRAWHLVARSGDELSATADLFLKHITSTGADGFHLTGGRQDQAFSGIPAPG